MIHSIETLLSHYESIINFRKRLITTSDVIKQLEMFFGNKISCASCPTTISKAVNDYERVVFTMIYTTNPKLLIQPSRELLKKTRFVNGMFETLVTSSFDLFVQLLESFVLDFKSGRIKLTSEEYDTIYNSLIEFNVARSNYFSSDVYLTYKRGLLPSEPIVEEKVVETVLNDVYADNNKKSLRKVDMDEAVKMHNEGSTYEEIATLYGVTRQAVYKLFKKHTKKLT